MRRRCLWGLFAALLISCSACVRNSWHKEQGLIWTTQYHITYNGPAGLADSVPVVLNRVDASLSAFNPQSLISEVNRSSNGGKVDSLLATVFTKSVEVNRRSRGVFDPTVSPLINLWGFGYTGNQPQTPSNEQIDSALSLVGIAKCHIEGDRLIKASPGMQFNFSAIAKGYAADLVADALQNGGATACMVEIGGEISLRGESPRGGMWRVSIDAPDSDAPQAHTSMRVVEVKAPCGIATSGNYRNFHQLSNRKVGHTISPRTGQPIQTDVISATVIAPTCLEADAYATACMAMTSADALRMITDIPGVEVLLVIGEYGTESLRVITSNGFPE